MITVAVALAGAVGVSCLDGSGLLAAYLIGLVIGDARIPHAAVVRGFLQGAAWLAQLGLFVLLGLLVTPSRVLDEGLGPILVAVALVLVARPLAVLLCATPFGLPAARAGLPGLGGPARRRSRSCSPPFPSPPAYPGHRACSTPSSSWSCCRWPRRG